MVTIPDQAQQTLMPRPLYHTGSSIQFSHGEVPDTMNSQTTKPVQWKNGSDSYEFKQAGVFNYNKGDQSILDTTKTLALELVLRTNIQS